MTLAESYVEALKLSDAMRRELVDLEQQGPYWRPQDRGELSVARALYRRNLLIREYQGGREVYELSDAGRRVAEHLKHHPKPGKGA